MGLDPRKIRPEVLARIRAAQAAQDAENAERRRNSPRSNPGDNAPTAGTGGANHDSFSGVRPPDGQPVASKALAIRARLQKRRKTRSGRRYRVEFTVYTTHPADWDAVANSCKLIQDEMVRQGWLPDGDGWRELEGIALAQKVESNAEKRVEVNIIRLK